MSGEPVASQLPMGGFHFLLLGFHTLIVYIFNLLLHELALPFSIYFSNILSQFLLEFLKALVLHYF